MLSFISFLYVRFLKLLLLWLHKDGDFICHLLLSFVLMSSIELCTGLLLWLVCILLLLRWKRWRIFHIRHSEYFWYLPKRIKFVSNIYRIFIANTSIVKCNAGFPLFVANFCVGTGVTLVWKFCDRKDNLSKDEYALYLKALLIHFLFMGM